MPRQTPAVWAEAGVVAPPSWAMATDPERDHDRGLHRRLAEGVRHLVGARDNRAGAQALRRRRLPHLGAWCDVPENWLG
jgi:hypothetical protein